jgi:hypothetical protein
MMDDQIQDDRFWQEVQEHEQHEWELLLKNDPAYLQWLRSLEEPR